MAEDGLDDAAFARLQAAGRVRLSHEMKEDLRAAIKRCVKVHAYSLNCSLRARRATANLAKHGPKVLEALACLAHERATFLPLVYEEGTDMAVFFNGKAIDARGDELLRTMPHFLAIGHTLVAGATRRAEELEAKKAKRRPANTHIGMLCREVAQSFEEAGGSATVGGSRNGPFSRFLAVLHEFLPTKIRPHSADALVKAARSALQLRKEQLARLEPRRYPDLPSGAGLDRAIAAALNKSLRVASLGHKRR